MKYCQNCGKEIDNATVFCPSCGCQTGEVKVPIDEGSGLGGFLLVFFLGLIGVIIALCINKPKTKKAAVITFVIHVILVGLISFLSYMSVLGGMN